jgi:hypothetical protein
MSKRKPKFDGPAYCDYQDLFDSITTELEKLYHTLWNKRKESPKFRTMGKQAKTAWMLWKLGSTEYWFSEAKALHYTNLLEDRRNGHIIYVRAKYEDFLSEWDETLNDYLGKVRHNKAKNLMMPYLARIIMEWRDGRTLYYSGLLTAMNTELMEILDFIKNGKTHADHRQTIIDLEEAIRLLHEAQTHIGLADEKESWTALFTHIRERYPWWYD